VYTPFVKDYYNDFVFLTNDFETNTSGNIFILSAIASFIFLEYYKECHAVEELKD
jgi:hypothetical protein